MEFSATLSNKTKARGFTAEKAQGGIVYASDVIEIVNDIVGYDMQETLEIQNDADLRARLVTRLGTASSSVPADEVLGPLHEED